jgi:hypothetical protein
LKNNASKIEREDEKAVDGLVNRLKRKQEGIKSKRISMDGSYVVKYLPCR